MDGELVGGSLEAIGLSCLRLSAPTINSPRKTSLISQSFFFRRVLHFAITTFSISNPQSTVIHVRDQQSHYVREAVSIIKCLVFRIHLFGANRFIVISYYNQFVCVNPACTLFGYALRIHMLGEIFQYCSLGSVIGQVDAK